MGKYAHILLAILCVGLTIGCSQQNTPSDPVDVYGEDAIYSHGDSVLYLCRHEWHGIVLSQQDPCELVSQLPWRVPTKEEGVLLHKFTISHEYDYRYLCQDEAGVWWSFLFGSGNVTKAGQKTKYSLRPIRWQVAQKDTTIKL